MNALIFLRMQYILKKKDYPTYSGIIWDSYFRNKGKNMYDKW